MPDRASFHRDGMRVGGLVLDGVSFERRGRRVLDSVSFTLAPGRLLAVVGASGAGKSTLLDLISGRLKPTHGHLDIGSTVKIGYYDQLGRELNVNQRVREAVAGDKGQPSIEDNQLMRQFWFDGDTQHAPISTLSGGERRRLQLLLTLIEQPNVLLLDEPTNDLDLETLDLLQEVIADYDGTVLIVSHDRDFLDRTVTMTIGLDGSGTVDMVVGGYADWEAKRKVRPEAKKAAAKATFPPMKRIAPTMMSVGLSGVATMA